MPKKQLASEALIDLHRRLSVLPSRSHERRMIMQETAHLLVYPNKRSIGRWRKGHGPRRCGAQTVVHRG
jgi:hypothetical protein